MSHLTRPIMWLGKRSIAPTFRNCSRQRVVECRQQRGEPFDRDDVNGALAAVGADSDGEHSLFLEPEEFCYGRCDE